MVYGKTVHLLEPHAQYGQRTEINLEDENSPYKVSEELNALLMQGLKKYKGPDPDRVSKELNELASQGYTIKKDSLDE